MNIKASKRGFKKCVCVACSSMLKWHYGHIVCVLCVLCVCMTENINKNNGQSLNSLACYIPVLTLE